MGYPGTNPDYVADARVYTRVHLEYAYPTKDALGLFHQREGLDVESAVCLPALSTSDADADDLLKKTSKPRHNQPNQNQTAHQRPK